jgi:hypothetical protein
MAHKKTTGKKAASSAAKVLRNSWRVSAGLALRPK